jgi:hypothetical protein
MDRNARAHASRQTSSLVCLVLTVASTALFATGVAARPAGLLWDRIYDVVLYDAPYLFAVVLCWLAGGRVRAERTAWRALAVAFLLSTVGNSVRTWSTGVAGAACGPASSGHWPTGPEAPPTTAPRRAASTPSTCRCGAGPRWRPA